MSAIELLLLFAMIALGCCWGEDCIRKAFCQPYLGLRGFAIIPSIFKAYLNTVDGCTWGQEVAGLFVRNSVFKVEKVGAEYHLVCQQCKTRYEQRRGEVWIFDGGEKKPYKRLVKHKGWV